LSLSTSKFPCGVSFNIPDKSLEPTRLLEDGKELINSIAPQFSCVLLRL
jgi:hypothetical protein